MKILSLVFIGILAFTTLSCENAKASKAGIMNTSLTSSKKKKEEKTSFVNPYSIGDVVEDFSLKNVDGKQVSLADFKNAKGFLVIFTCNSCPYAKMYEQRIIDLDKKYSPKGWQVIAINPNDPSVQEGDSYEKMQTLAKEKDMDFLIYLMKDNKSIQNGEQLEPHMHSLFRRQIMEMY